MDNIKLGPKYVLSEGKNDSIIFITNDDVVHSVPLDLGNTDYAEIMRQVDAGELTIEPADE